MSGLYYIENKVNGKRYVGQSVNTRRRLMRHKYDLRADKHINRYLQNAWNKYGEDNFEFKVIEKCEPEVLVEKEVEYIKKYEAFGVGYNLTPGGESGSVSFLGKRHTLETREKMHIAKIGKKLPKSTIKAMKESAKGFSGPHTEESKRKMSLAKKGRRLKPETIEKIARARKGTTHTEKTKRKMSEAHKGKKLSEETKTRISQSKRMKFTEEQEKEIKQRINEGESYRSIAKDFNCSHMTISRWFAPKTKGE